MWGEVIAELTNVHTGIVEQRVVQKNTLMDRMIDYVIGIMGYAYGVQRNTAPNDQRNTFSKWARFGDGAQFYMDEPRVISLGSGTTPFTPASIGLTTPIANTTYNLFTSREGGTSQQTQDNKYLKLSYTYDTAVANGVNINEIGLFGNTLFRTVQTFTGRVGNIISWTGVGNNYWHVHNVYCFNPLNVASLLAHLMFDGPPAANQICSWNRTTQTIDVFDNVPLYNVGDGVLFSYEPWVATAAPLGEFLAGVILPETIIKTVNHTLTIIWLIHFDANP